MLKEKEEHVMIFTKVIQDYMLQTFNGSAEEFNDTFEPFYSILEQKTNMFTLIDEEEWKENAQLLMDAKNIQQKNGHSFGVFEKVRDVIPPHCRKDQFDQTIQ